MTGSVHLIHKIDDFWIFKTDEKVGKEIIPKRFPFLTEGFEYEDGQVIEGYITIIDGVEYIKKRG